MAIKGVNDMMFKTFQPKVKNLFLLKDVSGGLNFQWKVKTVAGIGFEDGEIKLDYLNTYKKLRGKRAWNDINITMYDPINQSSIQEMMNWARLGYETVTGRAGYQDFYKKDLKLEVLGPVGDVVSEWLLEGAFIKTLAQGDFDWASPETLEISATIAVDALILNF